MTGNKNRAQMTLAELEAAIGWLERNQLREHLHLLDDDPRYAWTARQRGEWSRRSGDRPGQLAEPAGEAVRHFQFNRPHKIPSITEQPRPVRPRKP